MSADLEQRIEQTMLNHADGAGTFRFSADDVVRGGMAARRRRRRVSVAAVAGVVVLALGAGAAIARGAGGPAVRPGTTATPTLVLPTSLADAHLNAGSGRTLIPWNGPRISVALPESYDIWSGAHVPGGWVLEAYQTDAGFTLWFLPNGSTEPQKLFNIYGNWAVSADGRTLVASGVNSGAFAPGVTAYRLPTLEKFAETQFAGGLGPVVVGVSGDWVALASGSGIPTPGIAGAWNMATGVVERTDAAVDMWGFSDNGWVLRGTTVDNKSCVDIVPISQLAHVAPTGLCSEDVRAAISGSLSWDGAHAVLTGPDTSAAVLRTSDLAAGQWRPTSFPTFGGNERWVSATAFYSYHADSSNLVLTYCNIAGACGQLPTVIQADGNPEAILVDRGV